MGGAGLGPFGEKDPDVRIGSSIVRKGMRKGTVGEATRRAQVLIVNSSMTVIPWTKRGCVIV